MHKSASVALDFNFALLDWHSGAFITAELTKASLQLYQNTAAGILLLVLHKYFISMAPGPLSTKVHKTATGNHFPHVCSQWYPKRQRSHTMQP